MVVAGIMAIITLGSVCINFLLFVFIFHIISMSVVEYLASSNNFSFDLLNSLLACNS